MGAPWAKSAAATGPARQITRHPFDIAYGIDADPEPSDNIRSGALADAYNTGYTPSPISVARKGIEATPDLEQATFIEFGCGKGRVLALATEYPFRRIVGLELSPALAEAGRRTAQTVARLHPERTRIEVVEGDGLAFELPPGLVVMYLYHPAFAGLLRRLAKILVEHQASDPANKVFLIYCNPAAAHAFDRTPGFRRFYAAHHAFDADDFANHIHGNDGDSLVIWQSVSAHMYPAHPGANRRVRATALGSGGGVV